MAKTSGNISNAFNGQCVKLFTEIRKKIEDHFFSIFKNKIFISIIKVICIQGKKMKGKFDFEGVFIFNGKDIATDRSEP